MTFESLSHQFKLKITNFPDRWIPLIHLYDPDLPSFPLYYFHVLDPAIEPSAHPSESQRAFGYIEKINFISGEGPDIAEITYITNKDLDNPRYTPLRHLVENEIKERLGFNDPVLYSDIENIFNDSQGHALVQQNELTHVLWDHIIVDTYGGKLPFGRFWDEVLGLGRFVASFYSPSGRKSEMIMTHYFASRFGERISSSDIFPRVDFFLLPTFKELIDQGNSLGIFPKFRKLVDISNEFCNNCCDQISFSGITISKFNREPSADSTNFDTKELLQLIDSQISSEENRRLAKECYNAFNKGPGRTVIFFMMLADLRRGYISPGSLTAQQCGEMYDLMKREETTYQSPKVIQLYAQQCFGNSAAMPFDTWMDTIFKWPFDVFPKLHMSGKYKTIFSMTRNLGKLERLLWVMAQARKVHSSACNDAVWCIKYGYIKKKIKKSRAANPLSCTICNSIIRDCCPAYNVIKNTPVGFNIETLPEGFIVKTSGGNNEVSNQKFLSCTGWGKYGQIIDTFSPSDSPNGFLVYPHSRHHGEIITVEQFIRYYKN